MKNTSPFQFLGRFLLLLGGVAAIVAVSTMSATWFTTRRLTQLVSRTAPAAPANATPPTATDDVDFYTATGIEIGRLRKFLDEMKATDHLEMFPLHLSFWNDQGECLFDRPVDVEWRGGRDRVSVGTSGVARIMLRPELLDGLKFRVPQGYRTVTQRTIPLGTRYEPYSAASPDAAARRAVSDYDLEMKIWRELARRRARGGGLRGDDAQRGLRRRNCDWRPPEMQPEQFRDSAAVYRSRRDSVVIIGHLSADGKVVHAAGVVLDPSGVIATAYHVMDKPQAVARCVLTADGRSFPIVEILAADRPHDVALIRIEAAGLTAAPLSRGDDVGSPLTIVSHPGEEFFSVTEGCLRRFQTAMIYGVEVEQMSVTADFVDGASGGPLFNQRGEVAGIVSFRRPSGISQLAKIASPAAALWMLVP